MPVDNNDLAQVMRDVMDSRAVAVEEVNGIRFAVVPSGYKVHALTDLQFSPFAATPVRTKAHPVFTDAESLERYLDTFATSHTQIFANRNSGSVVAKIDYHSKEAPAWCEHTATLALKHSDEWIAWKNQNKQQASQETLAEFLEDHAPDIVDPSAARMLEIAETISVSANCLFDSKTNRANGQVRITFSEDVAGKAGKAGELMIPDAFKIRIPVYEGGEPVELTARFRFRLQQGKLTLWYDLLRMASAEREAFRAITTRISNTTGLDVMNGTA